MAAAAIAESIPSSHRDARMKETLEVRLTPLVGGRQKPWRCYFNLMAVWMSSHKGVTAVWRNLLLSMFDQGTTENNKHQTTEDNKTPATGSEVRPDLGEESG